MQELIDKLRNVEQKLSHEYGQFDLFALLERDDVPGRYDLVVAAPWLPANTAEAISLVFAALNEANLTTSEMRLLARVAPINHNDQVLQEIRRAFDASARDTIDRSHFGNVSVRSGIAFQH